MNLTGRDYVRELVRIRDKHKCQSCKKKWVKGERRFDVHHLNGLCGKKSQSYDKKKDMETLITLCHKCHLGKHVRKERFRVSFTNPLKGKTAEIKALLRSGKPQTEIARYFKVSAAAISQHLKRAVDKST